MKIFKLVVILFSVLLVLTKCTPKPLDIELPQLEPKLVIASQVIPGQIMLVTVTKSFGALEYQQDAGDTTGADSNLLAQIYVDSALVTISYRDRTDTLFGIGAGVYGSINTPQYLNEDYRLYVYDRKSGLSITSTARMLPFVGFQNVTAERSSNGQLTYIDAKIDFTDRENEENYYMVNFYGKADTSYSGNLFSYSASPYQTFIISDKEHTTKDISVNYKLYDWSDDTLFVSLSNISKEYYSYLAARLRNQSSLGPLLSEPVQYPSNIENGYGFFTTHYPAIRIMYVP